MEMHRNRTRTPTVVLTSALLAATALAVPTLGAPAARATEVPTCLGHPATIVGTPGNDHLIGTAGEDVIVGLAGDDVIEGLQDGDTLCGGEGNDILRGGGNTTEFDPKSVASTDTLSGGPGDDVLDVGAVAPTRHSSPGEVLTWAHSASPVTVTLREDGTGSATGEGTDTLITATKGTSTDVEIVGTRYDDVIVGNSRADWITPGPGNDRVDTGGGHDVVDDDHTEYRDALGLEVTEWAGLTSGNDIYRTGPGEDRISLADGDDVVDAGTGADEVYPGRGTPDVRTGAGNDWLSVRARTLPLTGRFRLGSGRDSTSLAVPTGSKVDLAKKRVKVKGTWRPLTWSSEAYWVEGHNATVIGTNRADDVGVTGKDARVRLRGGNDTLRVPPFAPVRSRVNGGAGRDRFVLDLDDYQTPTPRERGALRRAWRRACVSIERGL